MQSVQKTQQDRWSTNPPSVTTSLSYPDTPGKSATTPDTIYTSPVCGFGWGFEFRRRHRYQAQNDKADVQELTGQVDVLFQPKSCSAIKLEDVSIHVKATFPKKGEKVPSVVEKTFDSVPFSRAYELGKYYEPFQLAGRAAFEITLTFQPENHLSFPTTPSSHLNTSLVMALDGYNVVDIKFYLYSAKIRGQPGRPKTVFGNASLLSRTSDYLRDLVSGRDFHSGIACNLEKDTAEAMAKLSADSYDYDSDSDLESLPDEEPESKHPLVACSDNEPENLGEGGTPEPGFAWREAVNADRQDFPTLARAQGQGRAFAVNGTAYQTWKAFIFYAYTNEVHFRRLQSQKDLPPSDDVNLFQSVECSPKSMYRLADHVGLQTLKDVAKEGLRCRLTQDNIIQELFSSFTTKYDEVINMEVDFLIENMSPRIARELDNTLQLIILGVKPHCYRVLAFAIRRMRGEDAISAWSALDGDDDLSEIEENAEPLIVVSEAKEASAKKGTVSAEPTPQPSHTPSSGDGPGGARTSGVFGQPASPLGNTSTFDFGNAFSVSPQSGQQSRNTGGLSNSKRGLKKGR